MIFHTLMGVLSFRSHFHASWRKQ